MQIHLDALGGMAGDMFVAALLDAFPEHERRVLASVRAATAAIPVECRLVPHHDGVLRGSRFTVERALPRHRQHPHRHDPGAGHVHAHADEHHRPWAEIRAGLLDADLEEPVRDHALAIFGHLAAAEGRVHGIPAEGVTFHEVGAWDSIADIVAASSLIAALGASHWSVSALPLGSGRVRTAHGPLPVPAPATTILLEGFSVVDDGIAGERVTPTGAAILRHLCASEPTEPATARVLVRSGIGFGTKVLPGISNCVRALVFEAVTTAATRDCRNIAVIEFEVDDQSAEDLAIGLERLREHDGIVDVVQMPVFGKKGRMMTAVRVLARAEALHEAVAACFRETTTIGLRHRIVSRAELPRRVSTVEVQGRPVRVKTVERPGGQTAKAEADDATALYGHAARAGLKQAAERLALSLDEEPS
jgi:pyridinium-3,5-bisthiocarboxylic acid mononucleotide nickel chelatase